MGLEPTTAWTITNSGSASRLPLPFATPVPQREQRAEELCREICHELPNSEAAPAAQKTSEARTDRQKGCDPAICNQAVKGSSPLAGLEFGNLVPEFGPELAALDRAGGGDRHATLRPPCFWRGSRGSGSPPCVRPTVGFRVRLSPDSVAHVDLAAALDDVSAT
jgi:hypothetical protein